jgi:hypothetical protein
MSCALTTKLTAGRVQIERGALGTAMATDAPKSSRASQGVQMKRQHLVALVLIALPCAAFAGDSGLFYVAGGASKGGGNFGIGVGTNVDVLEINYMNIGSVSGNASARFRGLSLVQNAVPIKDFNLLFRVGLGKTTTTFANGAQASRSGFSKGVILGVGAQYQLGRHVALRAEVDRITYAISADGVASSITYPATLSALFIF